VTSQGLNGRDCASCGLPAVADVEVRPAQYRTVSRKDPATGRRTAHQVFERAAIVAAVCDTHQQITRGQPAAVPIPRQSTARDVEQLGLFASPTEERLRDAILGETGR
jgi:hypothetical protein